MTVKEWLEKGRGLTFELQELKEAKAAALCDACPGAVDYSTERVQSSASGNAESRLIKFSQYSSDLDERIIKIEEYRTKILGFINRIDNSTYRTLLIAYYINCKSWESVAEDMNYSVRHIHRLHESAVKKAGEVRPLPDMT